MLLEYIWVVAGSDLGLTCGLLMTEVFRHLSQSITASCQCIHSNLFKFFIH